MHGCSYLLISPASLQAQSTYVFLTQIITISQSFYLLVYFKDTLHYDDNSADSKLQKDSSGLSLNHCRTIQLVCEGFGSGFFFPK